MILLLVLALSLSTPAPEHLLSSTSSYALSLQKKCEQLLPHATKHHDSLASLVCGKKITDEELKENLSKTSLIHIFIISGSHLILFDQLLGILRIPVYLRFLFLSGYSLVVGWQAPAVRALAGLGLRKFLQQKYLHLPHDLSVLATGFVIFILFPTWWSSLSLQMSWCAALALSWAPLLRIKSPIFRSLISQLAIFFFMSAPLWGSGSLHPLSIVYNLFLAPIIAYVLLPLSFIATLSTTGLLVFDAVLDLFKTALPLLSDPIELKNASPPPSTAWLWIWIFSWHMMFHFLRLHLWQGKDVK